MSFTFTTEEAEAYIESHMSVRYVSNFRHIERYENPAPFDTKQAT